MPGELATAPPYRFFHGNVLGPCTPEGTIGDAVGMDNGFAGAAYPAANTSLFFPIYVAQPFTVAQVWVNNGGTVSGNFDIGLYTEAGVKLFSAGSTAQSGTATIQQVNVTDYTIARGRYLAAFACDNLTGQFIRWNLAAVGLRMCGAFEVAANFPLASPVTLASMTRGYCPVFGFTSLAGGI